MKLRWRQLLFGSCVALALASLAISTDIPATNAKLTGCVGSTGVASFELLVAPPEKGAAIPIRQINRLEPGDILIYEPVAVPQADRSKARVAVVLAQTSKSGSQDVKVLESIPASDGGRWTVPIRASVVGIVYGPRGLNVKNVSSLVAKNPNLIPELTAYATHSTEVEALVHTLSDYEQAPSGTQDLDAALQGFSTRFSVAVPKLDGSAPPNQQAATLLAAILPSLSSYDPLTTSRSALVAQEVGLASAVAGLFLGTPVGLAAGGAALFENMRTLAFPGTDFHSAFAQSASGDGVELCTKPQLQKQRTRPAYLWMVGIPNAAPPALSLAGPARAGLAPKLDVKVQSTHAGELRLVSRAHDWRLTSSSSKTSVPVAVTVSGPGDVLQLDLAQAKVGPGQYHLAANWDWTPIEVKGSLDLRPFANLTAAKLAQHSADRMIAGNGKVQADLTGPDFEFVTRVALQGDDGHRQDLGFTVPKAAGDGPWDSLRAEVDTSTLAPGDYKLAFTQSNGETQSVPVTIHAVNPSISNLPLRVNVGEAEQKIELDGSGLDRIAKIVSPGAAFELAAVPAGTTNLRAREAILKLSADAQPGQHLVAEMNVAGIAQAITIPDAIEVDGPRPKITAVQPSFPQGADALKPGELPAGLAVSFAIRTANVDQEPAVQLACLNSADTIAAMKLQPASADPRVRLDVAGDNALFLSLDPATVGRSGCELAATVSTSSAGASDPYKLGRIVRLPRIEKFTLSDHRLDRKLYAGTLTGEDLQLIEKTGWNSKNGYGVTGIPTPVSSDPAKQTLDIALPWPPPSPQAPLYIWLRGEAEARETDARY